MGRPAISVVMPVYNGQDYVLDAVASIAEQSFEDWELLCVNDGSSDGTAEILDWCVSRIPGFVSFINGIPAWWEP